MGNAVNIVGTLALSLTVAFAGTVTPLLLAPSLAVIGFGQGLGVSPLIALVLRGVPERYSGAASGALETVVQFGQAVGVAVLGSLLFVILGGREVGLSAEPDALAGGFVQALWLNVGLAVLAILLVPVLLAGVRATADRTGTAEG